MNRRAGLVLVAAAIGVLAQLAMTIELIRSGFVSQDVNANYVTLAFAIVFASVGVGVAIARDDGWSGIGAWLACGAAGVAVGYFRFSTHPWLAAPGFVIANATALVPLHAAVSHRDGVPVSTRRVLVGAHLALATLGIVTVLTAAGGTLDRWFVAADAQRSVDNPLLVIDAPVVARAAQVTWWILLLGASALVLRARVARWSKAPPSVKRNTAPIVAGATAWILTLTAAALIMTVERAPGNRGVIADFGAVVLPVLGLGVLAATIGWVELVRPRLGRASAGSIELLDAESANSIGLRAMLVDLFATPNVDVVFADEPRWVDIADPSASIAIDRRHCTVVRRQGEPVAAILHEPDISFEALELGARLIGAQVAVQRATTLAQERAEAVRLATGQLVRAGDRASTTISSLLSAGPLRELDALASGLRAGTRSLADAAATLRTTTTEVRELSHGLYPRELEEHGLARVLGNDGTPTRRFTSTIEMTCYLLAHDDDDASFTERGDEVVVRRSTPLDADLIERVSALGGRINGTVAIVPTGAQQ